MQIKLKRTGEVLKVSDNYGLRLVSSGRAVVNNEPKAKPQKAVVEMVEVAIEEAPQPEQTPAATGEETNDATVMPLKDEGADDVLPVAHGATGKTSKRTAKPDDKGR